MKLTKRRSSPYLPFPSSLWTSDTHYPNPTPPLPYSTPLGSKSTASLLPTRLPFRRRGQSAGPELPLRSIEHFGTDYEDGLEAQTYTQRRGIEVDRNVFFSSYDDLHTRRPVYTRSISAVGYDNVMVGLVDERKRDRTGQNRYPPNTLAPSTGWGFGRMRRNRKQDLKIDTPERVESLRWKDSSSFNRSEPCLPSPTSPSPLCENTEETVSSPMAESSISSTSSLQPPSIPSSPRVLHVANPSIVTRHLSFIIDKDQIDGLRTSSPSPLPGSPSSLSRSASLSETVISGESSLPLIESIRRRSSSLAIPKFRKYNSNPAPRKLQKRRSGLPDPSANSSKVGLSPLKHHLQIPDVVTRKEDHDRTTQAPPIGTAEGQGEPDTEVEEDAAWTLARNSSTSTTCSSMIAPSTEESTVLTPPYHAIGDSRGSAWEGNDDPTVSRSSTLSYSSTNSRLEIEGKGLDMMDMKQILQEDNDSGLARSPVRPQASFLSSDTVMPMSSTKVDPDSPSTHGSSSASTPAVDFTASPIDKSASPTSPDTSTSTPINRLRYTHIHTHTDSIASMSISRDSEYSIGSIGEIGVANTASMAPTTTVHLTPAEARNLSPPQLRPGVQRSKSEIGHPLSRAPSPFLSKEPLKSSPDIPLPITKPSRPKPSPRLSLPLLDIETIEPEPSEPEKKVFSPSRSLSLGKLWRKISTSRRKTKSASSTVDVPAIPTSVSCVDVSDNDILASPTSTFRLPLDDLLIPEVPTPAPRTSSLAVLRQAPTSISFSMSTTSVNVRGLKPIGPRKSSLSTPPSLVVSDHSHPGSGSYFPHGLTGSRFPRAAEAPSTRTILEGVTLTSTPDDTPNLGEARETRISPPRVARRRPEHRRARFSMDGSEPSPSLEERRKYRQTLLDIQDDVVFHQVLQDLARLERKEDEERERETSATAEQIDEKKKGSVEWKADKGEIRAWFVTRELVQGERRHGRLLARGVATVQAAAESRRDEVPPLPVPGTPDRSSSAISLTQLPSRTSFLSRRATSRSTTSVSTSTNSSSTHLSPLSINISPMLRSRTLPTQAPPSPTTSPLELLLERLPRLLALSLTLSSRFEDDPSPFGVAEAFVKMEEEMIREIGLWAGEVGNIVAVGMGEMLDMSVTRGRSRRSISGDAMTDDESQEDRLGFADIIIMPIQRAARYKLLFQEMLTITPTCTRSYTTVHQALISAEKLAGECDRRQVFDLHSIRRQSNGGQAKKKGKKRPRSVGVNIDRSNDKNWVMGRGVEV